MRSKLLQSCLVVSALCLSQMTFGAVDISRFSGTWKGTGPVQKDGKIVCQDGDIVWNIKVEGDKLQVNSNINCPATNENLGGLPTVQARLTDDGKVKIQFSLFEAIKGIEYPAGTFDQEKIQVSVNALIVRLAATIKFLSDDKIQVMTDVKAPGKKILPENWITKATLTKVRN